MFGLSALALLAIEIPSSAFGAELPPFCLPGVASGQCNGPRGLAVDEEFEVGPPPAARVYVADRGNDRVDVFAAKGESITSFAVGLRPERVAVDNEAASPSRHDVYVANETAPLVRKFKPSGSSYEEVGAESFGTAGTGPCQFSANDQIAVGPGGQVYVADSFSKNDGSPPTYVNRVLVFSPNGTCIEEHTLFEGVNDRMTGFAVDSSGHMYLSSGGGATIRKYGPAGELELDIHSGPEDNGTEAESFAVDSSNHLFVKQRDIRSVEIGPVLVYFFTELAPSGAKLRRFGYVKAQGSGFSAPALAAYHSEDGDLYASEGAEGVKYLPLGNGPELLPQPCEAPQVNLGSAKASLKAWINPEGQTTAFRFEYLTQAQFEADGGFQNARSTVPDSISPSSKPFDLHSATVKAEQLEPETKYRCRVVAENGEGAVTGVDGTFITREPFEFGPSWSANVGETAASIFVEGNPLEIPATGQIEYVEDGKYSQSGFAEAQSAPNPELDFGNGDVMKLVEAQLTGLKPGTLYHYRLRARNGVPPEGIVCPEQKTVCPELEHTFRTYLPEAPEADQRRYELVSPGQKNSAEVAVPGNPAGFAEDRAIRIQSAAGSGDAVTYTSWTSFGAAEGAPSTSQYLSRRVEGVGWRTENVSPFGFLALPIFPPFNGFTPELDRGVFKTTEPALTADCRRGSEDMYRRNNATGQLECLSPEVAGGPESPCIVYGGASEDGTHAFVAGKPEGGEAFTYRLYEETAGAVAPVSVLPGGSLAPATGSTGFGPGGFRGQGAKSGEGIASCAVTFNRLRNAISADGSRAFWTYAPEDSVEPSQLYVRVNNGETGETLQLDKHQSGPGTGSGEGKFWSASSDGSAAYFTDKERLVSGANPASGEPDLYRYRLGVKNPLTDITKGAGPGNVQGVIGASDDGSYVYFVAKAALPGGQEENAAGQKAKVSEDNLYLFHEGSLTFIATLAPQDSKDWSANPRELSARVSPDGKHLGFLSIAAKRLTGYDNEVPAPAEHCKYELTIEGNASFVGSPLCAQAFLYDAAESGPGTLTCASCNPSGARPLGPTILPGWSNGFEGPRYLSDNGSRLFFQTWDALLPADVNGKSDVYEFERPEEGSCSTSNPDFDSHVSGCHALISTGKSTDESFLVDASANGRDVFFSTRQILVGWDVNENFDVYDSRVDGGFPEPAPPSPFCEGEGDCLHQASTPPPPSTPTTPSFNGPGNPQPRKPKPHKRRSKHHKTRKSKKHHKKKGQGKKGRAER